MAERRGMDGWQIITDWVAKHHAGARFAQAAEGPAVLLTAGDPTAEHAALTQRVALVAAPDWAPILIEGKDAVSYLHRRLSQAIAPLELGRGAHALQLAGDGRVQAEYLIYRGHEALIALAPWRHVDAAAELIEKYTLNDEVEVDRFWRGEVMFSLAGPLAPAMIAGLLDPKVEESVPRENPWCAWFTVNLAGLPCRIFRDGRWPFPYFHVCVPPMAAAQLCAFLHETMRAAGGMVAGAQARELARIEAGLPQFGVDVTEGMIPLEAHLRGAIHFNKGCYPGQEFIARIVNLGHPANALVRLELPGEHEPAPNATIKIGGQPMGRVSSSITWPGLGRTAALGYVKWEQRGGGLGVVEAPEDNLPAKIHALSGVDDGPA